MDETSRLDAVNWHRHWLLESGTAFLNHGSFGACPKRVLKKQSELRRQMESQPVRFFDRELRPMLDRARAELAEFVGADLDGFAFVPNATTGINTVLRSRSFDPGDELLITDHTYGACRNAIRYVAERSGADVRIAHLPFPTSGPDEWVDAFLDAVTPRTELALLDHVASPTGLIVPLERLVDELHDRHVDVLVDGAHAPGMLDLDIDALDVEYYVGNCHKWLCAPKGSGFLYVDEHHRDEVRPLSISNGASSPNDERSRFQLEFEWTGTDDPTPYLCVPEAIDCLAALLPEGWKELRARNRDLAREARDLLCDVLGIEVPAPDRMLGSMAAVPLPDTEDVTGENGGLDPLDERLSFDHGFEVAVKTPPSDPAGPLLRVSAQLYNERSQYERLADALTDELDLD